MPDNRVLVICNDEVSMEPAYGLVLYLADCGYSADLCHVADSDSKIKASRVLDEDLSLSGYQGLIALDDGGDPEILKALIKNALDDKLVLGGYGPGLLVLGETKAFDDRKICSGLPAKCYEKADMIDAPSVRSDTLVTAIDGCITGFAVLIVDALGGEIKHIVRSSAETNAEASVLIVASVSQWPMYWPIARDMKIAGQSLAISDPSNIDPQSGKISSGFLFGNRDITPVNNLALPKIAWMRDDRMRYEDMASMAEALERAGCRGVNSAGSLKTLTPEACQEALAMFAPPRESVPVGQMPSKLIAVTAGRDEIIVRRGQGDRYVITCDKKNVLAHDKDLAGILKDKFGGAELAMEAEIDRARLGNLTYRFEWGMVRGSQGWAPCSKLAISDDDIHPAEDVIRFIFPENPDGMEMSLDEMASTAAMILQSLLESPEGLGEITVVMVTDDATPLVRSAHPGFFPRMSSKRGLAKLALSLGLSCDETDNTIYILERELAHEGIWLQPDGRVVVDGCEGPRRARDLDKLATDLKYEAIRALEQEIEAERQGDEIRMKRIHAKSCRARHRFRIVLKLKSMLEPKREKLAFDLYPSSVAGPYAHVELPLHERVFTWQEGDDILVDREKAIMDLRRYNPEYLKMTPYEETGIYCVIRDVRLDPSSWINVMKGDDTTYPMRNLLKAASSNVAEIEEIVDTLFGGGIKAHVARMLMTEPLDQDRLEAIRSSVKRAYPNAVEAKRKSSMDALIHEVKTILDQHMAREAPDALS